MNTVKEHWRKIQQVSFTILMKLLVMGGSTGGTSSIRTLNLMGNIIFNMTKRRRQSLEDNCGDLIKTMLRFWQMGTTYSNSISIESSNDKTSSVLH